MSLRSAAIVVPERVPGPLCGVRRLRAILRGDDLAWFDENLPLESGNTSAYLSNVLKTDGHYCSEGIIQRHRLGKCHCAAA